MMMPQGKWLANSKKKKTIIKKDAENDQQRLRLNRRCANLKKRQPEWQKAYTSKEQRQIINFCLQKIKRRRKEEKRKEKKGKTKNGQEQKHPIVIIAYEQMLASIRHTHFF